MHSAITSAIGASGALHGGANEAVFRILEAIDESGADPIDYVKGMLAQKRKILASATGFITPKTRVPRTCA
jgi:citrate synthase